MEIPLLHRPPALAPLSCEQPWWGRGRGEAEAVSSATHPDTATHPSSPLQENLVNGPLGKSGFLAAFSLILVSEIGDKTFFIAALLAMKLGKWISFLGSLTSLGVMTIISVSIGVVCSRVRGGSASETTYGVLGFRRCYALGFRNGLARTGIRGEAPEPTYEIKPRVYEPGP